MPKWIIHLRDHLGRLWQSLLPPQSPAPIKANKNIAFALVRPRREVNRVFLHCTASDHAHHDNLQTLHAWHVEQNGWSDIGYHYLITFDGGIHVARPIEHTPAAQAGHNTGTIAIALSGGQNGKPDAFTQRQFQSLRQLCHSINRAYDHQITFHGHCEVAPGRACPVYDYCNILGLNSRGEMKNVVKEGGET